MKSWLQDNNIEMYSTYNEKKICCCWKIYYNLKEQNLYDHNIKNVDINKLDDRVKKYNNTYHITIKTKPVDVKASIYTNSGKEINDKNPKFEIDDIVRISKLKNIFAKGYVPNCSKDVFAIKKVKNTTSWTYVISDLKGEETVGLLYKKE